MQEKEVGPSKVQKNKTKSSRGKQVVQYHGHLKVRGLKFKYICQVKKLKGYFKRRILKIEKVRHELKIKSKG